MMQAIQNLIPRLKTYSKALDKKEHLVGRTWVLVRESNSNELVDEFTFERSGLLYLSDGKGKANKGSWKLLGDTNQLVLDLQFEAYVLKPIFADQYVMLLTSLDGTLYPFMTSQEPPYTLQRISNYLSKRALNPPKA